MSYHVFQENPMTAPDSRSVESAPIGTKAPAIMGGHWYRTERGWKWNGPDGTGGVFPRPGGDWTGQLIPPALARGPQQAGGEDVEASIRSEIYMHFDGAGQVITGKETIVRCVAVLIEDRVAALQAEVARLTREASNRHAQVIESDAMCAALRDRAETAEAALREESARLDWLIENRHLFTSCNGQWFAVIGPAEIAQRDAARAAIDAALNGGQDDD